MVQKFIKSAIFLLIIAAAAFGLLAVAGAALFSFNPSH